MFFIGQNLNLFHMTYSFLELLIFFLLTQVDIYCLGVYFPSHHRNIVSEYKLQRKAIMMAISVFLKSN